MIVHIAPVHLLPHLRDYGINFLGCRGNRARGLPRAAGARPLHCHQRLGLLAVHRLGHMLDAGHFVAHLLLYTGDVFVYGLFALTYRLLHGTCRPAS